MLASTEGQGAARRAEGHAWQAFEAALVPQGVGRLCGIASALTVMRALGHRPDVVPEAVDHPTLPDFLGRIGASDKLTAAASRGLSLSELDGLLVKAGIESEAILAIASDRRTFTEMARACLREGGHVIVNYARRRLGQKGGGHFSPLAAYDPETGRFLLVDVATEKSPPIWVQSRRLFAAMKRPSVRDGMPSRGFILIHAGDR